MKKLTVIFLGILLSLAFAQDNPPPVMGGEAVVSIAAEPPGWDPTVSPSQEISRVMYHNVYEGLVRVDQSGDIVPALAESYEISEDGLTWTFTLRDGVKFHDGSDFTVEDVVAQLERFRNPESAHPHPEYYETIENVSAEGNQVTLTLSDPTSGLLFNLARADSIIYPAGTAETQRNNPVGTGPFRFVEWIPGSEVRLEKFSDYYLPDMPYLDAVTFRIITDANARFAALQAGDIDMIGVALPPESAIQTENNPDLKLSTGSNTTEITVGLNGREEPFNNPLVRQAISHAIDKNVIVEGANFGFGTAIGTFASPIEPYFVDVNPYPYNPEEARRLLEEAGYADGLEVRFELPEPYNIERRAGEVIAQQLSEVGVTVNLSVVEWTTWLERIYTNHDYDMTIIGHSEPRDIGVYADPTYYFGYDNPEVQTLVTQAERATSEDERNALYQEVARIIADDAASVWIFNPDSLIATRQNLYGFWTDQPIVAIDMTQVYKAE